MMSLWTFRVGPPFRQPLTHEDLGFEDDHVLVEMGIPAPVLLAVEVEREPDEVPGGIGFRRRAPLRRLLGRGRLLLLRDRFRRREKRGQED